MGSAEPPTDYGAAYAGISKIIDTIKSDKKAWVLCNSALWLIRRNCWLFEVSLFNSRLNLYYRLVGYLTDQ